MGVLLKIRLIPRVNNHFTFDGRLVKSVHGHGDGVGVGLHIKRSVLDQDLRLPKDEVILFITWRDFKRINKALAVSDRETLKLRKNKGWKVGPRPFDKKHGLRLDEDLRLHELI